MLSSIKNFNILDGMDLDNERDHDPGMDPIKRSIRDLLERGIIILDKPAGPTSHEVVSIVKKILGLRKAGHPGTLDPQVTGVLPIALNSSTKVLFTLLNSPKEYICNMFTLANTEKSYIKNRLAELDGVIYQFPPKKSNVAKKLRKRQIFSINLLDTKPNEVLFSITSQAGTYIRTICTDFARLTGKVAYMKELRRIKTGPFNEKVAKSLHRIYDSWSEFVEDDKETYIREVILPIEVAVVNLPHVMVKSSAIKSISHGASLKIPGIIGYSPFIEREDVAIISPKCELIGIGKSIISSDEFQNKSYGDVIKPRKIIYPKIG